MLRAYPDIDTAWARLATYLGERIQPELTDFETLRRYLDQEWRQLTPRFYEHSIGYLYDLTHFHYMGIKDGFFAFLLQFADEHGITGLADIGCGIGLDAQTLRQAGYEVHGYDLDNPSLNYARWRLDHDLGASAHLHPIEQLTGRRHPLAYAVDVLGHTDDPAHLAKTMLTTADYVCLNLGPHDQRHRPERRHPLAFTLLGAVTGRSKLGTPNTARTWTAGGLMAEPESPLASCRLAAGHTQESLAEKLEVERGTVGRWERGVQAPQPWQRAELAKHLDITLTELDLVLAQNETARPTCGWR